MKMSPDLGPQVLPAAFGPSPKPGLDSGPQINGGPNVGFTPTKWGGPQINPGLPTSDPLAKLGYHGPQINPGIYGQPVRTRERSRFFPAASGLPGDPSVHQLESYQGGPAGRMNAFRVRSGWTFGF